MTPSARNTLEKAAALAALGTLAAASLTLTAAPPEDPALAALGRLFRGYLVGSFRSFLLLSLLVSAALLASAVVLAIRAYLRGARVDWWEYLVRRLWQTALACGLLALAGLLLPSGKTPRHAPAAQSAEEAALPRAVQPARASASQKAGPEPAAPFLAAGATLLAAAVVLALLLHRRRALEPIAPPREEAAQLTALRRRLELGDHVRDAIISCYAEMCQVFDPGCSPGSASLTAREFAALLRSRGAGEPEILALTSVFEKARYSLEPCGEADREQALEALRTIEGQYGMPA